MNAPRSVTHYTARSVALLLVALIACGKGDGATGLASNVTAEAAVIVEAAEPDTVTVDTTVVVRITGSGFTEASTATWLMDSVEAPGIRTISTTYHSPTELVAIISVAPDAELRAYRIRIRTKKGKQGIGVERFRVVAKPIPLPEPGVSSEARDVNDSGVIVGWASDASGAGVAIKWTPADTGWSYSILGPGTAPAVNNEGLIFRYQYDNNTRVYQSWIHLPSGGMVSLGPAVVNDISNDGTLVGVVFDATLKATGVAWRRSSATNWGAPQPLPLPPGYSSASPSSINSSGDITGSIINASGFNGVVWRYRDGQWLAPVPIDSGLQSWGTINDKGAVAGSFYPCIPSQPTCYSSPAFWPSAGGPRQVLPTLYNSRGFATGLNNDDLVIGSALVHYDDGSGPLAAMVRHPVIWFPGGTLPEDLGAIRPYDTGSANAINNHGLVVGSINDAAFRRHATVWKLP